MLNSQNFRKMRSSRIHSGAEEYFSRKRKAAPVLIRKESNNIIGKKNWGVYLYWIVGGLAAVALIYFVGNYIKTKGVAAKIVFQEGEVLVKRKTESEWEKVPLDTKLKKYSEVKTTEGSKAIINFDDGSLIRIGEYSRIILSEEKGDILIIQTDGTSYHRVGKGSEKKYLVELSGIEGIPKVKIESLGTAFWVRKIGTELNIGVVENRVKYQSEENSIEIEEGQKLVVKENQEKKNDIAAADLGDDFIYWNLEQDEKKELAVGAFVKFKITDFEQEKATTEEEQKEDVEESNSAQEEMVLSGEATNQGVALKWELKNVEAPDGFKIVKGSQADPQYPGSYYRSVKSQNTLNYTWDTTDGKTYHFRVCVYDGSSGCALYSNDLEVETKKVEDTKKETDCENSGGDWDDNLDKCNCPSAKELKEGKCVAKEKSKEEKETDCKDSGGTWNDENEKCSCSSGEELKDDRCVKKDYANTVSLTVKSEKKKEAKLRWSISGGGAPDGYKIVKSKSKDPSYPGDDSKAISSEYDKAYTWKDLKKGETYYFRVCVYNSDDDKCVEYSDDKKVEIKD